MESGLWGRISDIFAGALEQEPAERDTYVERACRGDDALRLQVAALLSHFEEAGDFLEAPALQERQALSIGDVVGNRYRIERLIGRGGMGEVYRAQDELIGEAVALKTLRRGLADGGEFVGRFRREVQLARKVTHPAVCRIFEVGVHGSGGPRELHFFVMQIIEGETLAARVRREGKLDPDVAVVLAIQMAEGLDAAHTAGIIHRDFKSSNVMLCDHRPVIMDFGLARAAFGETARADGGQAATTGTHVAGTVAYMSPEQLSGEPVTAATDVYSFGIVLFEMTTGRLPFNEEHIIRSAMQRVSQGTLDVRSMAPDLDARVAAVIARCLRRDPAQRYCSAGAIASELRRDAWRVPMVYWNRRQWAKAAVGVGAAAAAVSLVPAAFRLNLTSVELREGAEVLLGPIANATGDARFDATTELFRNQLAQSVRINLITEDRLAGVLAEMGKPGATEPAAIREGAWRLNAALTLFGNVSRIGSDYALNVQVETRGSRPDDPRSKALQSFLAPSAADLMRAVRDASVWVREVVGESNFTITSFDRLPEYATTPSWEALAAYARGQRFFMNQDYESAILEFEAALRIDPQFTLAALRRADLLMSQGRHTEGFEQWRHGLRMLEERPATRPEELHARSMFAFDSGDMEASDRFARTWAIEYPNDWRPPYYRVGALIMNGRARQALEVLEPLRASVPDYGDVYAMMIAAHIVLGETNDARALLPELRSRNRPERADIREAYIRFREGDLVGYLEMLRQVQRATAYPRGAIGAVLSEALLLVDCGLPEGTIATVEAFLSAKSWVETEPQERALRVVQAWAEMLVGKRQAAVARVQSVWTKERGPVIAALAGTIFTRCERGDLLGDVLQTCASFDDIPLYRYATHRILGEQARAQGRMSDAVDELRKAAALEPTIAHRQYLIEVLPPGDPDRLALCVNAVRIPWQALRPPPLHCLGSMNVAVPAVLAAVGIDEPFARRFDRSRADVARMV